VQAFEQVLVASEHVVPFKHSVMVKAQLPAEHSPVDTPTGVQVVLQLRLAPSGAVVHLPGGTFGTTSLLPLQVWQSLSEQASLQQNPSTQKPLAQSVAEPQAVPTSGLQVLSFAQAYPLGQGTVDEHAFEQVPPAQWVPFVQVVLLISLHWPVPSHEWFSAAPLVEQMGAQPSGVLPEAKLVQRPSEPAKAHEPHTPSPQDSASQQ
jgi:hypothetical protein